MNTCASQELLQSVLLIIWFGQATNEKEHREHGRRMGETLGTLLGDRCGEKIWLGRSTGRGSRALGAKVSRKWKVTASQRT